MSGRRMDGWRVFAVSMLVFGGAVNFVQGMVASFAADFYRVDDGGTLLFGYAVWGLVLAVWGAVLMAAGAAALSGHMWARVVGVLAAGLNAVAQLAFVEPYPVWAVLVIVVDVMVVYGLTAAWTPSGPPARAVDSADEAYRAGRADADDAPVPGDETRGPKRPLHHGGHEQSLG
ncbi:hypothetical protein O4J56_00385 [Nocardiopsis sp. RSe5-2]|uniref:DUF7144 domain-containing protein n=1 Tax=Nocardiopsis endophytica TaxID=3018445 RepID=A0ABT4TWM3_9ACTN|nr:hypothetical protein [Nocardiopsis endophytica]MDA2809086.1 hypothetical protein [Nocardiopsis endophytica]